MKKLTVIAAGFGWKSLLRNAGRSGSGPYRIAGLEFAPKPSVFPAVTCVAQASLRTGLSPFDTAGAASSPCQSGHGMISNGWWSETLRKPLFWEQSARLVKGPRVWDRAEPVVPSDGGGRAGSPCPPHVAQGTGHKARVGIFFFQQSLGENVDVIISPAPIHKHGGGMMMSCYTKPTGMAGVLEKLCGRFPLWRYWGPLSSPKVGRMCIRYFEEMTNVHDVDEAYLYLPTLDYAAQKYGPDSPQDRAAFREFAHQLETLADICMRRGCKLSVMGDYDITPVTKDPLRPNVTLRQAGLFRTRTVGGRAYPDFYQSAAFAMCDHEFCVICGEKRDEAVKALLETGEYEFPVAARSVIAPYQTHAAFNLQTSTFHLLLAKPGSWCEYKWWTDDREAPDFASHVDIHNKPGYDPTELFFFGRGTVRGTHGRACEVAVSR